MHLFQAINIFNREFAHLRRALKETVVPLLLNNDIDKLSNSMQTLLPSTLSPAAQILPLFRVHCPSPGRRTTHTDVVTTPPTTTEPRLLQSRLKARLNSRYKSRFAKPTTKPGSFCSSLPLPPPPLQTAVHFRVPRSAPPVHGTSTSRCSQRLQPSHRARSYPPLCLLPPCSPTPKCFFLSSAPPVADPLAPAVVNTVPTSTFTLVSATPSLHGLQSQAFQFCTTSSSTTTPADHSLAGCLLAHR